MPARKECARMLPTDATVSCSNWDRHQMDVIRHQAIANQGKFMQLRMAPQQVQIDHAVGIGVEDVLPRVPTLRYMMRNVHGDHASQSSHGTR